MALLPPRQRLVLHTHCFKKHTPQLSGPAQHEAAIEKGGNGAGRQLTGLSLSPLGVPLLAVGFLARASPCDNPDNSAADQTMLKKKKMMT